MKQAKCGKCLLPTLQPQERLPAPSKYSEMTRLGLLVLGVVVAAVLALVFFIGGPEKLLASFYDLRLHFPGGGHLSV